MSQRTVSVDVEVSLDDLDDEDIFKEARARSWLSPDTGVVSDLSFAIAQGRKGDAQLLLDRLLEHDAALLEVARAGRFRVR